MITGHVITALPACFQQIVNGEASRNCCKSWSPDISLNNHGDLLNDCGLKGHQTGCGHGMPRLILNY